MKIKSNPPLTVLTIVFGLLFLNYFLENKFFLYLSLIMSGIGIISLKISVIIEKMWFNISFILSQIIPNILLSLIFYLILTPIALLSKLFNSQTNFNSKNNKKTMFICQTKSFNKESFERAW